MDAFLAAEMKLDELVERVQRDVPLPSLARRRALFRPLRQTPVSRLPSIR